jgi:DNA topoisomerase-2
MYTQKFTDSLSKISKPKITTTTKKDNTTISFKLKCHVFPSQLFISRCILLLPILPKNVTLTIKYNEKLILKQKNMTISNFYVNYFPGDFPGDLYLSQDKWDIVFFPKYKNDTSISFVNGNITYNHGKHVDFIFNTLLNSLKQKYPWLTVNLLSRHSNIIASVIIDKPEFSSQTKDTLTTSIQNLPQLILQNSFIKKFIDSVLFLNILKEYELKQDKKLSKQDGKKKKTILIPNLHDANFAGTKQSDKCALYLTEGLSALTFVIAGMSIIGKDYNGAFPLKVPDQINVGKVFKHKRSNKKTITNK